MGTGVGNPILLGLILLPGTADFLFDGVLPNLSLMWRQSQLSPHQGEGVSPKRHNNKPSISLGEAQGEGGAGHRTCPAAL